MKMQVGAITKDDIEGFRSLVRTGIYAEVLNNAKGQISDAPKLPALIAIDVNDYVPAANEPWDVDDWEARQGYIYAPVSRENWKICYRIARGFMKGPINITDRDNQLLELPSTTTINC